MDPDARSCPWLTVDSGVHRAASAPIPMGETRVGSALEAEIGLSDIGAPVGFLIRRAADGLVLCAVDADLDLTGAPLRRGRERSCRKTLAFTSGGIHFRLDIPATSAGRALPRLMPSRLQLAVFAGGAVCASAFALFLPLHGATALGLNAVPRSSLARSPSAAAAGPSGAMLLDGLRRQVKATQIETVDLRLRADGAIAATGTIAPAQETAWQELGRWFDTEAAGRFVLVNDVRIASTPPALRIQAVWSGRNPYVVDGAGHRLFVGSTMEGGWLVNAIDRSRLLIKRGEQVVAVRF